MGVEQPFPWEDPPAAPERTLEETVALMQRDFQYAVLNTAVIVHSDHEPLRLLVNTARGQVMPRGRVKFTDGTWLEVQDIGMCQPNAPHMTVQELLAKVLEIAKELGLELEQ